MAETQNFFDNPNGNASGAGWGAGVGGLIGAAIGNGGGLFGGGNRETATLDQVDSRFNALQGQINSDQVEDRIAGVSHAIGGSTAALSLGLNSVKDAVVAGNSQNALSLCGLGHSIQSGIASVNQNILLQGAASRERSLQQALDAERSRATDLRIQLSEAKNHASHTATQVMIQNLASAK